MSGEPGGPMLLAELTSGGPMPLAGDSSYHGVASAVNDTTRELGVARRPRPPRIDMHLAYRTSVRANPNDVDAA